MTKCRCEEQPSSSKPRGFLDPPVFVLTTSEGRDKLFKALQCSLKLAAWSLVRPGLLPDGNTEFRQYWVDQLLGNVHTIRNGRALFKLGRWLITLIDLMELGPQLRSSRSDGTSRLPLLLIVIRCTLAIVRNALRDFVNLSTKSLFGLHLDAETRVPLERFHAIVASVNWLLIATIDLGLTLSRLLHREWVPPPSCVPCSCSVIGKRLCFGGLDMKHGCPSVRNGEFLQATHPSDMTACCRGCGMKAKIGNSTSWAVATPAPPSFARAVSATLYTLDVVRHHPNLWETLLLACKGVFDLGHAACSATMILAESDEVRRTRWFVSNSCGLMSSLIAVRRVWLSCSQ